MLQTPLTIQRLYDDNRESLQLGWFAGFPGGERLGSTGLGHGVAVPHGRIKGNKTLKAPLGAFVRLAEPIPFESPDGKPVSLLFFLLIPDHVTQQHLEILSEIAEMFSDDAFRTALATDPEPKSVHSRIVNWQPSLQAAG